MKPIPWLVIAAVVAPDVATGQRERGASRSAVEGTTPVAVSRDQAIGKLDRTAWVAREKVLVPDRRALRGGVASEGAIPQFENRP